MEKTFEYEVTHPKWKNYEVLSSFIQIDFKENYGTDFEFLQNQNHILFYWQKVLK